MKTKHLILFLTCLSISFTTEAQLLKKLKKKAEQAAERTLLRKTEEIVTKKTEQAIDSATTPKPKKNSNTKQKTTKKAVPASKQQTINTKVKESEADLHLLNKVDPYYTALGETITFTIHVVNKGPASSNDIVSKVHIPNSYSVSNISVNQGSYNEDTELWDIGNLGEWKKATMTIVVVVVDDRDLLTTAEVVGCSTKDPDSTPSNGIDTDGDGNIIDDRDDEDDGDGQDVKLGKVVGDDSSNNNNNNNNNNNSGTTTIPNLVFDQDIKMVMEHKRDKIISYLDFDTMAMRLEDHSKGKKNDPIYWDKDGYIYSGEKGQYYKIPFKQIKSMGKNMMKMFTGPIEGMPFTIPNNNGESVDLEWYEKPIIYNGYELYVSPNRYPMLEWAFIYRPEIFIGANGVKEETIPCRGNSDCTKFTVKEGKGVGSTILFDSKGRLAEITNADGAKATYTYEQSTVKLPNAQEYNFPFKN